MSIRSNGTLVRTERGFLARYYLTREVAGVPSRKRVAVNLQTHDRATAERKLAELLAKE